MSFNVLDKLAYANKENENYVSFLEYFNTELSKKKTQELKSIKEDFSVYIKLEDDKARILESAHESLKGKLKSIKQKIQNTKRENEIEIEDLIGQINLCAREHELVEQSTKAVEREKSELVALKNELIEKQNRLDREFENETKKLQVVLKRNESKKDEVRSIKLKQDELLAEMEETSKELKENLDTLKEENRETKIVKKKYYNTKLFSRSLVEYLNKLKYENNLDLQEKELLQTTIREREQLTAELSQIIIGKLDPHGDARTVKKLNDIMKELDTIIEYGKNISQHILHLKEMKVQ